MIQDSRFLIGVGIPALTSQSSCSNEQKFLDRLNSVELKNILDAESLGMLLVTAKDKLACEHKYAFSILKDGRCQTKYEDPVTGQIRFIKRSTKKEVLDELFIRLYGNKSKNPTFEEVFLDDWIEHKDVVVSSEGTIVRLIQRYDSFLAGSELAKKPVRNVSVLFLEEFCNALIKDRKLGKKEWMQIRGIINGVFEQSFKAGYLESNPLSRVTISARFRQVEIKPPEEKIFSAGEQEHFQKWLLEKFSETGDTAYVAIYLDFFIGVRVGELVTLQWRDLKNSTIHVARTEVVEHDSKTVIKERRERSSNNRIDKNSRIIKHNLTDCSKSVTVADHTKAYKIRDISLCQELEEWFAKLREMAVNPDEKEFIFQRNGERLRARQIESILTAYAREFGLKVKRSHAIRRTYASNLYKAGFSLKVIQRILGHKDLSTTERYIYEVVTEDDPVSEQINRLFSEKVQRPS